jgi:hypothetical protein
VISAWQLILYTEGLKFSLFAYLNTLAQGEAAQNTIVESQSYELRWNWHLQF